MLWWKCLKIYEFDVIAGIPYTALPIATAVSLDQNWPMVYARKEVKDYGQLKRNWKVYMKKVKQL